jgi:alcohol dehydrogenase class IV
MQEIRIGNISFNFFRDFLEKNKVKRFFLVHGRTSFYKTRMSNFFSELSQYYFITKFSDYSSNPKINDVKKGIDLFLSDKYDMIIAVGGGTSIDIAKLIKGLSDHNNIKKAITNNKNFKSNIPLVAIPTTSGTGSESTHFAVVYVDGCKYSFSNQKLLPNDVFLDGKLSISGSNYLRACSGLDALCQAIESHWSVNSNNESRKYSSSAIIKLLKNLKEFVLNPSKSNFGEMAIASNLSGRAINITKTTAPHAISYPITSIFNIPHGHAVAISMPFFIQYNSNSKNLNKGITKSSLDQRLNEIYCFFGVNNAIKCSKVFKELVKEIGVDINVLNGLDYNQKKSIIKGYNFERGKNNPVNVQTEDLIKIL